MNADLERAALDYMKTKFASSREHPGGFVSPFAMYLREDGDLVIVEMPDLSDQMQRWFLKDQMHRNRGVEVVVVTEAWAAGSADPEEAALLERLHAEGRLRDAPKHLLHEVINVSCESRTEDITIKRAPITLHDGVAVFGDFEAMDVRLPYPGFKRYL